MTGDLDPRHDQGERPVEPLLPEALAALTTAARQHGRARRRRWSPWRGAPLAVLVVFLTGTAVAATTQPWAGLFTSKDHPSIATKPVPAQQRNAFAVLRAPQTATDRTPGVRRALRAMFKYDMTHDDVHLDGVRVLDRAVDRLVFLVPIGRTAPAPGGREPDGTRQRPRSDQLCMVNASSPPRQPRRPTEGSEVDWRPQTEPGVAIDGPDARAGQLSLGWMCATLGELHRGRRLQVINPVTGATEGLVRDGIVSVEATSHRGKTVVGTVRDNYFSIKVPTDEPGFRGVPIRGRTADGHLR